MSGQKNEEVPLYSRLLRSVDTVFRIAFTGISEQYRSAAVNITVSE